MNMKVLIVIPARGGSKGVPRKNLRPLAGKPLIYYSIKASLKTNLDATVVVSTDDEEIALFASRFGAEVMIRPAELSTDAVTIDPVIVHVANESENKHGIHYDVIVTVQPTSPLINAADIENAANMIIQDESIETVISAVDDRHLRWLRVDEKFVPDYKARVNRQQLPPVYRETGAVLACRRTTLAAGSRIGKNVQLSLMSTERAVDIDSTTDFYLCESLLKRRKIIFVVAGRPEIGLGHAFRAVMIAHELVSHEVMFLCTSKDQMAIDYIRSHNYPVQIVDEECWQSSVIDSRPDLVINDILDTDAEYVDSLHANEIGVVNFEDMGSGAEKADLVVNALYPHQMPSAHILTGPKYFCLRDEFLHVPSRSSPETVQRILLTFGGVDEGDLTGRVLEVLTPIVSAKRIAMDVVLGPGYLHGDILQKRVARLDYPLINIVKSTPKISDYMIAADLAITSGGRTVLELASLRVPMVVICQNHRETTHTYASSENGIVNLGLRHDVSDTAIQAAVQRLLDDESLRLLARERLLGLDLSNGKQRVMSAIDDVLHNREI